MGKPNDVWDIHLTDSDIPGVDEQRLASGTRPFPDYRHQMLISDVLVILKKKTEMGTSQQNMQQ
jgi:hypothetical protein